MGSSYFCLTLCSYAFVIIELSSIQIGFADSAVYGVFWLFLCFDVVRATRHKHNVSTIPRNAVFFVFALIVQR